MTRATPARGQPQPSSPDPYAAAVEEVARRRAILARRWAEATGAGDRAGQAELVDELAAEIAAAVGRLSRHWLGTRWGLGVPQARHPGSGKINCGTFVGTILRDAGFMVDVLRLQRQPSQLIIRSFVDAARMKRWSRAPMERFLADVKRMGPGIFIIGLDFHVGFLIQEGGDLRFVHASYETRTVVDEPAATARPIVDSGYRVVGKLLDADNVRDWLEGRPIRVKGDW